MLSRGVQSISYSSHYCLHLAQTSEHHEEVLVGFPQLYENRYVDVILLVVLYLLNALPIFTRLTTVTAGTTTTFSSPSLCLLLILSRCPLIFYSQQFHQ